MKTCPRCEGAGVVPNSFWLRLGRYTDETCEDCGGSGQVEGTNEEQKEDDEEGD